MLVDAGPLLAAFGMNPSRAAHQRSGLERAALGRGALATTGDRVAAAIQPLDAPARSVTDAGATPAMTIDVGEFARRCLADGRSFANP